MTWVSEITADAPDAWWRLGSTDGQSADSSANAFTLTRIGANWPTDVPGLVAGDTAASFDGTGNDCLQAADDALFDVVNTTSFTVELIVNAVSADASYRRLVSHELDVGSGVDGWNISIDSTNGFSFSRLRQGGAITDFYKPTPLTGAAYHLVGTYDGTNQRLYVNKVLQSGPSANTANMIAVASTVQIGKYPYGSIATATIDEVLFYSGKALTLARIEAHYDNINSSGGKTGMGVIGRV